MSNEDIIKLAKTKKKQSKDFGIFVDEVKSAKAYLYIFYNIKL